MTDPITGCLERQLEPEEPSETPDMDGYEDYIYQILRDSIYESAEKRRDA